MTLTQKQAEKAIKLRDNTLSLFNSKLYKAVIENGYFKDEAMRLPLALVDDEMQDEVEQRIIKEKIAAIGHLHVYLNSVIALGNQVEESLKAEEREKARELEPVEYDDVTGDVIDNGVEI